MKIHIKKGDKTFGPHSKEEIKQLLSQGDISTSDSAFIEGTNEWITVKRCFSSASNTCKESTASFISATKLNGSERVSSCAEWRHCCWLRHAFYAACGFPNQVLVRKFTSFALHRRDSGHHWFGYCFFSLSCRRYWINRC